MISTPRRRLLITTALPYASGPPHLGHMLEFTQADIWARFQRLRGQECWYICGTDAHGTPIMLQAEKMGITPEALIARVHQQYSQDCADFSISFDHFYTTHSEENRELSSLIYQRLSTQGDITTREIYQAFDEQRGLFLPDRYVKGTCPRCHKPDQYGDNCEACGATYSPTELIDPRSVLSNTTPVQRSSLHYFFDLPRYQTLLEQWTRSGTLQPEITNKLDEWFSAGLQAWDISRDAPYFGFEIPGAPQKYFYVWLDAPIGYMASFKHFCRQHSNILFNDFWKADSTTELYHFIGKDIVYFHALFWPAMLQGAGFRLPTSIFAHGFVTINGEKMSKSRGTFILARHYLEHLDPTYLRYYFAAKLNPHVEDVDLNLTDFMQRVNSDLVGKVVNLASRSAKFIQHYFDHQLSSELALPSLYQHFIDQADTIAECYETRHYSRAIRLIMELADRANQYIDEQKPWEKIKNPATAASVHGTCSLCLNLFRVLMVYLSPVVPNLAEKTYAFLRVSTLTWDSIQQPLLHHTIAPFSTLLARVQQSQIDALLATATSPLTSP